MPPNAMRRPRRVVPRARWLRGRAFLDALYRPAASFRVAVDEAIACRCEEVTGAALRDAARRGATGPNQAKALLRGGMGPCQGRLCMLTVVETIAAKRGVDPATIAPLRIRPPVKPVTLAGRAPFRAAHPLPLPSAVAASARAVVAGRGVRQCTTGGDHRRRHG
jgi:hypothetical protein